MKTTDVEIMDTNVKTSISKQGSEVHSTKTKIVGNRYELKTTLKNKVYLETYQSHQLRSVIMDEIQTNFKAWEMQITKWTLTEDQQLMKFNMGIDIEP